MFELQLLHRCVPTDRSFFVVKLMLCVQLRSENDKWHVLLPLYPSPVPTQQTRPAAVLGNILLVEERTKKTRV